MVITILKSICKTSRNVGISILVAIAPHLIALDSSIDALLVFPKRLPIQNMMGTGSLYDLSVKSQETSFLTIETIDLGKHLFSLSLDTSSDQLDLSASQEFDAIFYRDKEFFCFDINQDLPLLKVVEILLLEPACNKKHIFQNETYPDFTSFGQFWSKNPLGFFSFYEEHLSTDHLMNPDKWTIQDSSISSFLQSSIIRLENELDEQVLSSTPLIEKSKHLDSLVIAAQNISDLRKEYILKNDIDFYKTSTHLVTPFLTDASCIGGKMYLLIRASQIMLSRLTSCTHLKINLLGKKLS